MHCDTSKANVPLVAQTTSRNETALGLDLEPQRGFAL
jgi:hypothetical protein